MVAITTKQAMYRHLYAGRYGNVQRNWPSIEAVEASGYRGLVSIRSRETSNPVKLYHVPFAELRARVAELPSKHKRSGLVFWESPDDSKRTLQGEVSRLAGGLYLTYSFVQEPMRHAFAKQQLHAYGLGAHLLLKRHIAPLDLDELMQLLDDYPDATVEFSGFSVPVGVLPGRRMVVWEVRNY